MAVYCVTVRGEGFCAEFGGKEIDCGLFKNEFVWASSSDVAVAKALDRVRRALHRSTVVNPRTLSDTRLRADRVEHGLSILCLLERQGFVFHPIDQDLEENPERTDGPPENGPR